MHCWPDETKLSLGRKMVLSFIYDLNISKSLEFEFLKDFYGNKDFEFSNPSVMEKDILQKAFVQKNKMYWELPLLFLFVCITAQAELVMKKQLAEKG